MHDEEKRGEEKTADDGGGRIGNMQGTRLLDRTTAVSIMKTDVLTILLPPSPARSRFTLFPQISQPSHALVDNSNSLQNGTRT